MGNERNQSILLTMCELAEALQQFALVEGKLRAVQAQAWLVAQCAFLNEALFEAGNNFRIHAAMVLFGDIRNTFAHAFWKADNELVCCAT